MNNLITTLRDSKKNSNLHQLSSKELEELILLCTSLSKDARILLEEMANQEEDDSDDEFIEIEIDGKPDLIKRDIKVLNISCNRFKTLPKPIYKLKKLQKLYLYSNEFSSEEKIRIRKSFPASVQIYF